MKCLLCSKDFFNFHANQMISCIGGCDGVGHEKCVAKYEQDNLSPPIKICRSDNKLTFVCPQCLKNTNNDTNKDTGSNNDESILSVLNEKHNEEGVLTEMFNMIKGLIGEVRDLRNVNDQMRAEIADLNNKISVMSGTFAGRTRPLGSATGSRMDRIHDSVVRIDSSEMQSSSSSAPSSSARKPSAPAQSSLDRDGPSRRPAPDLSDDLGGGEFTLVSARRRSFKTPLPPPLIGTGSASTLRAATRRSTKSFFVSRLAPESTCKDLEEYIKSEINVTLIKCTPIKTKFNTYASFHVSVDVDDFDKLNREDAWPAGIIVKPFHGRLYSDIIKKPLINHVNEASDGSINI